MESNTSTSKLVYDFIAGFHRRNDDGSTTLENGRLALFRNFDEHGNPLPRPNTLLIDSEQIESGEALNLGTLGRWAFAELTEIYQIESDFEARVANAFDAMIVRAGGALSTFSP